ncbi:MAG TPA: ATP-binding protein [Stellaceae bacterium]|jgi:two-component system phosphate regulon sensor histidine kinase PhoR|nr:ATP-binding protein [Stellaceae bacterium]
MTPIARWILGALAVAAPSVVAFASFAATGDIPWRAALIATLSVFLAVLLLLRSLVMGVAAVQVAVDRLAAGEGAPPEVDTLSPSVRELWLAVGRWARASRQKLAAREAELGANQAVLAALPDPLILLDERRRIFRANVAANELLGMRLIERDLAVALRHPAVLSAADAVLHGEAARIVEFDMTSPIERHLSARFAALQPHTSEGAAALLTLHDLTAAKRSERLRADFVANASHELRTPLASLIGFIETLRGPAHDDAAARDHFLGIMAEQSQRMKRLVDDLLSLSRIEMNEHRPPTERVDLERVLRTVADLLDQRSMARDMRITLELPAAPVEVQGDPDELAQVFQNLLDNAIKYGRPGTPIEVSARPSPRFLPGARPGDRPAVVAVAVRDHGDGIPREHLPRLTERFYRVDAARSRELGGTGLGLAIVKHIVNRHRGALDIESELGHGSIFTVHLPQAPG